MMSSPRRAFVLKGGAMSAWNGVRKRVLSLGPPPRKDRGLRRLLRRPLERSTPLLDDPLTEDEVSSAERQFGVVFPEEYRGFLLEVGAGGFGPDYGLASLACHEGTWGWPECGEAEDTVGLLAHPLPSDEERARWTEQLQILENAAIAAAGQSDEEIHRVATAFRAAEDELHPAMTAGAIRLSHGGCGYYTWLVVTGEERGNLWFDPRCVDEPLAPLWHKRRSRTRFAEWYLEWLDELQGSALRPGV
jgi:SMI1 / KNR4 family (SUKH-1)